MNNDLLWQVGIAVVTVMGSVNAYFVSRLVSKIDKVDALSANMNSMQEKLNHIQEKMTELTDLYQRLIVLEKQVAVIEFVVRDKHKS